MHHLVAQMEKFPVVMLDHVQYLVQQHEENLQVASRMEAVSVISQLIHETWSDIVCIYNISTINFNVKEQITNIQKKKGTLTLFSLDGV